MKKEDLLAIEGMTDAIAAEVVKLSGEEMKGMIPKSRLDEVIAERDHAKADHADVLKQLGALQKETGDVEGMKTKIAELETAAKDTAKAHTAEIRQLKIDNAVNAALSDAKALNTKAVRALLDLDKAELDYFSCVRGDKMKLRNVICADDGMVLTDGEIYGKVIFLAEGVDPTMYYEITDAEYEEIVAKLEAEQNN